MGSISPEQIGRWYDAHSAALVLYVRQWLQAGLAEDVVQDVFVRLASQRRPVAHVKAWLFRSVRNAALNQLRSQRRRRRHEQRLAAERPTWFAARADDLVDAKAAQAALESLPPQQREIIVLRIWGQMTLAEAADIVGLPVSTVFGRYRAGLDEIRRRMKPSCKTKSD